MLCLSLLLLTNLPNSHCDYAKFMTGSPIEALSRQSLSECVLEASRRFFTSDFESVTFSSPLEQVNRSVKSSILLSHLLLPMLQRDKRWTFLIKNLKLPVFNTHKYITKSYSYIVHIRKDGELSDNIKGLKMFLTWNPHAQFLVISPTVFASPHKVAVRAIQDLWEHNVINAVILLPNRDNTTKYDVYSWKPYSKYSCANNFSSTRLIDSCSFGAMEKNKLWFKPKISKKAHNCSVRVSYMAWPPFINDVDVKQTSVYQKGQGIEINLLNTIANQLNIRLQYTRSPYSSWGNIFENGIATNDMKRLQRNEIDIIIGGYGSTYPRTLYFDCSDAYMQEPLVWCVPFEPYPIGFRNMITILNYEVWIAFLLVYFGLTFGVCFVGRRTKKESSTYKRFGSCLFNNYAISIGAAVNVLPKTPMVRHTTAMFLLLCLISNSVYTSYFTSIISAPRYGQKYDDMEDIYRYNLKTYFVANSILFFQHYDGEKEIHEVPISVILERWRNCTDLPACLNRTATRKDSAFCIPRLHGQYLSKHDEIVKKIKRQLYCLKKSVVSVHVNLIMRKGFPLFILFDQVLKNIITSGLIDKWVEDNLEDDDPELYETEDYEKKRIKFENLLPVFQMIVVVYVFAILIFLLENLWYKREMLLFKYRLLVGKQYLN